MHQPEYFNPRTSGSGGLKMPRVTRPCWLYTLAVLFLLGIYAMVWNGNGRREIERIYRQRQCEQLDTTLTLCNNIEKELNPERLLQREPGHMGSSDMILSNFSEESVTKACWLYGSKPGRSIGDVFQKMEWLKISEDERCKDLLRILNRMYLLGQVETSLVLPPAFEAKVKSWLGNNEGLFNQIYQQKVYRVINLWTGDASIYNPLRSKRPVSNSGLDPKVYVENLANSSGKDCDFCRYKDHTAADLFGRVESDLSATASNTFKLGKFHGLFFPKAHHPLNISYAVLHDLFVHTAMTWFKKAYDQDNSYIYPTILWDSLPHAGASQVHPHVHGLLENWRYSGSFDVFLKGASAYYKKHSRSMWTDLIIVHTALGLSLTEGKAVALVPLTARKDHEFWILAPALDEDVIKLLYRILQAYKNSLGTFCYSSAAAFPPFNHNVENPVVGLPVFFRIGSRGDCTTLRSDVSSLELYTVNNINTDIDQTISALRNQKP